MKKLNIWLLKDGDLLPVVPGAKKMRTWLLAESLVAAGHKVTWFSSTINHMEKKLLFTEDTIKEINPNFTSYMIYAGLYKSNISFARIWHHIILGRRFAEIIKTMPKPNIIVSAYPTIEFAYEAVKFGKAHNIPVIVDVRDMWPDIFADYLPKPLKPFIKLAYQSLERKAKYALKKTEKIVSMSKDVLKFAMNKAHRQDYENTKIFYLGCEKIDLDNVILNDKIKALKVHAGKRIIVTFLGTFGYANNLKTICKAARQLHEAGDKNFFFILAGNGMQFEDIKKEVEGLENIVAPGWMDKDDIKGLISITDIGMVPTKTTAIPNKLFDYFSTSKPVLASILGEGRELFEKNEVGYIYDADKENDLIDKLNKLIDKKVRQHYGKNGQELFDKYFDGKKIYADYASYVEKVYKEFSNIT